MASLPPVATAPEYSVLQVANTLPSSLQHTDAAAFAASSLHSLPDTMDQTDSTMFIHVLEARDLINKNMVGKMDVSVQLTGMMQTYQTAVIKEGHTAPTFNESFSYPCRGATRSTAKVELVVESVGALSKTECGRCAVNLFQNRATLRPDSHALTDVDLWLPLTLRGKNAGSLHVRIREEDPAWTSEQLRRQRETAAAAAEAERVRKQQEEAAAAAVTAEAARLQLEREAAEAEAARLQQEREAQEAAAAAEAERMRLQREAEEAAAALAALELEQHQKCEAEEAAAAAAAAEAARLEAERQAAEAAEAEQKKAANEAELRRLEEIARKKADEMAAAEAETKVAADASSHADQGPGFTPAPASTVVVTLGGGSKVIPAPSSSSHHRFQPELVFIRACTGVPLAWSYVEAFGRRVYSFGLESNLPPVTDHSKRNAVLRLEWVDDHRFLITHPGSAEHHRVWVDKNLEPTESAGESHIFRLDEVQSIADHKIKCFIRMRDRHFMWIDETWLVGWKLKHDSQNKGAWETWTVERAY